MRIIGTDVSLDVCKGEGYMMMQYDARKRFDPDAEYRAFCYYPEFQIPHLGDESDIRTDERISFNRLKEVYLENKESLDSCCETHKFVDFENPDYYDFLNLASDVVGGGYV